MLFPPGGEATLHDDGLPVLFGNLFLEVCRRPGRRCACWPLAARGISDWCCCG
ncbi:hypothetical protein [Paenirhodobacter sp.]|uniref:hypothetical protein n=1 Tax=Paenirhodobacter sp. TaxID=1965326 RepID=UPI003B3EE3D3